MRRGYAWAAVCAFACATVCAPPAVRADRAWARWDDVHDAIASWRLDSTRVARVQSVLIQREGASIVLERGRIALARELGGRRCALVFAGRGALTFDPPSMIERQQLRRYYGTPMVRKSFRALAILFTDSTLDEIAPLLSFQRDTITELHRAWQEVLPYVVGRETDTKLVKQVAFAHALVDGDPGYFWAAAWDPRKEPMFVVVDPFWVERVQLRRTPESEKQGLWRRYASEVVSQYRAAGDSDSTARDQRAPYEAVHYDLDVALASDLRLTASARVDVRAHDQARTWVWFNFTHPLVLDSVTVGGRPATCVQDRRYDIAWVRCDPPLAPGETRTFAFRYHGQIFEREASRIFLDESTGWYPSPWFGGDATWDIALRWPADYQLVCAGERVAGGGDRSERSGRWRIARPVPWASFNVGFLHGIEVAGDSVPTLTAWETRTQGSGQVRRVTLDELANARAPGERIARDLAHAAAFYRHAFGPPVLDTIQAVETPRVRDTDPVANVWYDAYPGLVRMMTPEDKLGTGVEWTPDYVRAHELAHQWWGESVRPWSYHDRWLSEGFADFCAIWYLQAGRQDEKTYFATLRTWRDELLENRKFLLGSGQQAGPIWLGTRTNSSTTIGDYDLVVYKKGAWVLHMLRNYLLDLNTLDESRFRGMMRSFYATHANDFARTEDLRAAAESAVGEDMGWFFRQWVYGTDVPTYRVSWAPVHGDSGWSVRGRIEQSNVPDDFHAPMIVRIELGGGRFARARVWVHGPVTEFTTPPTPEQPQDVVFNDLESVLADVQKAKGAPAGPGR